MLSLWLVGSVHELTLKGDQLALGTDRWGSALSSKPAAEPRTWSTVVVVTGSEGLSWLRRA